MEALKSMRNKIFIGLIQGIGFGLVFGFLLNYYSNASLERVINEVHDNSKLKNIAIQNLNEVERDAKMHIIGNLKNNNQKGQKRLTVQADFYDNNTFVEQCQKNIKGTLKSQEQRNFKISCDGVVKHDSYEVYLLNKSGR